LAAAAVDAPLLATNTHASTDSSRAQTSEAPFPLYRMARSRLPGPRHLAAVGYGSAAMYALRLALTPRRGSRRDVLENALWYRRFLWSVQPDLIHVQHPLERCEYVRLVQRFERWTTPLVVTAHSLFGEHPEEVIHTL